MKRWCSSIIKCAEISSMRKPLRDIQLFYRKKGPIHLLCKIVTRIIQRKSADDAPDRRGREFGVFDGRSQSKSQRDTERKTKTKSKQRLVCRAFGGTFVLSAVGPWSGFLLVPHPFLPLPPAARVRSPWGPGARAGHQTLLWSPAPGPLWSSSPPHSAELHRGTWWAAGERARERVRLWLPVCKQA